jgi:hypothetical protein
MPETAIILLFGTGLLKLAWLRMRPTLLPFLPSMRLRFLMANRNDVLLISIQPFDTASLALRGGFAKLGSLLLIFFLWRVRKKPIRYAKGEL